MNLIRFFTALREHVRETIEGHGHADIVIAISSYHSGSSLAHVIQTVVRGLETHYHDAKALIMISDGCLRGILARAAEQLKTYSFNHYFFQQQAKNE